MQALLRSILAAHPFDLQKVQAQGISMELTRRWVWGAEGGAACACILAALGVVNWAKRACPQLARPRGTKSVTFK